MKSKTYIFNHATINNDKYYKIYLFKFLSDLSWVIIKLL